MSDVENSYDAARGPPNAKSLESDEAERLGEIDPVYEAKLVRKLDLCG